MNFNLLLLAGDYGFLVVFDFDQHRIVLLPMSRERLNLTTKAASLGRRCTFGLQHTMTRDEMALTGLIQPRWTAFLSTLPAHT